MRSSQRASGLIIFRRLSSDYLDSFVGWYMISFVMIFSLLSRYPYLFKNQ
jgi:hypothetical protein